MLNILLCYFLPITLAEGRLEQDPDGIRQLAESGQAGLLKGIQAVDDILLIPNREIIAGFKEILVHIYSFDGFPPPPPFSIGAGTG